MCFVSYVGKCDCIRTSQIHIMPVHVGGLVAKIGVETYGLFLDWVIPCTIFDYVLHTFTNMKMAHEIPINLCYTRIAKHAISISKPAYQANVLLVVTFII